MPRGHGGSPTNASSPRPRRAPTRLALISAAKGMLFPSQANILETEVTTATRVAEFMFEKGLAQAEKPGHDIRAWIESQLYQPQY